MKNIMLFTVLASIHLSSAYESPAEKRKPITAYIIVDTGPSCKDNLREFRVLVKQLVSKLQ